MIRIILRFLLLFLGSADVVYGAGAPKELFGKSVVVSWSENLVAKYSDQVDFQSTHTIVYDSIYISSTGRVFSQTIRRKRRSSVAREQSPGSSKDSSGSPQSAHFEGSTLMVDTKLVSGALRVTIDFASGFDTCNAKVIHGKENGQELKWVSWRRPAALREAQSVEVQGLTCAMKQGNVFDAQ